MGLTKKSIMFLAVKVVNLIRRRRIRNRTANQNNLNKIKSLIKVKSQLFLLIFQDTILGNMKVQKLMTPNPLKQIPIQSIQADQHTQPPKCIMLMGQRLQLQVQASEQVLAVVTA